MYVQMYVAEVLKKVRVQFVLLLLDFFTFCVKVNCCCGFSFYPRVCFVGISFVYLIIKYGHLVSHVILMIFFLFCFVRFYKSFPFRFIDLLSNFWCQLKSSHQYEICVFTLTYIYMNVCM